MKENEDLYTTEVLIPFECLWNLLDQTQWTKEEFMEHVLKNYPCKGVHPKWNEKRE